MIHNELLRKAVQTQYTLVRLPLTVLDEHVVTRYAPRGSKVQQSFARALGALDATAERLLSEESAAPRSSRQPTSAEAPVRTPAPAEASTPQPSQEWSATPDEPADGARLPVEEQQEVAEVAEELLDVQQERTFVGELADDDELRRMQAELQAKHLVEEAEEQAGDQPS